MNKIRRCFVSLIVLFGLFLNSYYAYCDNDIDIKGLNIKKGVLESDINNLEIRRNQVKNRISRKDLDVEIQNIYKVELKDLNSTIDKKVMELNKINNQIGYYKSLNKKTNSSINDIVKQYTKSSQKLKGKKMRFIRPLKNYSVTSRYGYRIHPIYGKRMFHNGIDLGDNEGTKIRVIESGLVIKAGEINGYGNTVLVMHRRGYISMYGHMVDKGIVVKTGDVLKRGELLGYVGSTGASTGDHLHLEIFKDGHRIDPCSVIKF